MGYAGGVSAVEERDEQAGEPPAEQREGGRPPVVLAYRVYSFLLAVTWSLIALLGVVFLTRADEWANEQYPRSHFFVYGGSLLAFGITFGALYLASLAFPRRPWAWTAQFVLIALGLTNVCMLPAALALLLVWRRPETRDWFRG